MSRLVLLIIGVFLLEKTGGCALKVRYLCPDAREVTNYRAVSTIQKSVSSPGQKPLTSAAHPSSSGGGRTKCCRIRQFCDEIFGASPNLMPHGTAQGLA